MQQDDKPTSVCWRVKASTLEWLRATAREQDRPVNWVANRMLEAGRKALETQHAKTAA